VELAERYECVWAAVGVHPHDARDATPEVLARIGELATHPRVVAVGESGLDFYRDLSPREVQAGVFEEFAQLAAEVDKALIVHSREAEAQVLEVLAGAMSEGQRVVRHCFGGEREAGQRYMELGCYLGISATVTYPGSRELRETVGDIEGARLVLETDCPWLPPQGHRGKRNEPALMVETAEKVAEVRGADVAEIAAQTTANAGILYGLAGEK